MSVFSSFSPRLQEAIVARLGWTSLRPVQELAGEALLAGENAVILAPTAGGKTEAAFFPALSMMIEDAPLGVGVIYVAPIKALLNNQADRLGLYTEMVGLTRFVWHGDVDDPARRRFLKEPTDLVMTTPESLEVMLVSPRVDERKLFGDLRMIVIDEVHAFAGTDRGAHLSSVIERIAALSRHDVQRVGLSATVGNPEVILKWMQGSSRRAGRVVDPPKKPVARRVEVVHRQTQVELAREAARSARGQKSLFFCQSRATTEAVAETMGRTGTTVFVHHSAVSREQRQEAEARFAQGTDACIVCTSTLELGIDVGDLDRVLQADAPSTVSSFMQRMGRTGRRAGQVANTTFYCETVASILQAVALVELAKSGWVESIVPETRCWPVLIHQLVAMSLADSGVNADDAWAHLSRVPDFACIDRAEFDRLVEWLLHDEALCQTAGRLVLGPKVERQFGRRNFMELYAVFSSPQTYTVQTASGQAIGTLTQDFVDRLVEEVSCFLLGGRAWLVTSIRHTDRRVVVDSAPRGREPSWGSVLPQFLGRELCERIRALLVSTEPVPFLDGPAAEALAAHREEMREVLEPERHQLEFVPGELRWWNFAGGRINATLRYAIEAARPDWSAVPSNFMLRLRGPDLCEPEFRKVISHLRDPSFFDDPVLWQNVAAALPAYRISKFQPLMPHSIEHEVISHALLDIPGTREYLNGFDKHQTGRC